MCDNMDIPEEFKVEHYTPPFFKVLKTYSMY